MRYIIALLVKEPHLFIQEALKQFSKISQGYLLSNNSLPHITLAPFDLNAKYKLSEIWNELFARIKDISQPKFIGIGFSKKERARIMRALCIFYKDPIKHTYRGLLQ